MTTQITIGTIATAIAIGTAVGPLSSLVGVQTADLQNGAFWWDVASNTIRSFASVTIAGLGLLAGAFGIPALRTDKDDPPNVRPE